MKLGYYAVLDMLLGIRHIYASERFVNTNANLGGIGERLNAADRELLFTIGDKSHGWLEVIEWCIELVSSGISAPEEMLIKMERDFESFESVEMSSSEKKDAALFLNHMWQDYFIIEASRSSRNIFEKIREISNEIQNKALIDFIDEKSDRTEKLDNNTLKIFIKPEVFVNFDEIEPIIMPSIFASRKMMFWNKEGKYIFFISTEQSKEDEEEPSDMLLLKTLALNDKTRLKMLRLLYSKNYSAMELAQRLNLNASTVSRHFKVFKDAGFVDVFNQEGNVVYYSINEEEIKRTMNIIIDYLRR